MNDFAFQTFRKILTSMFREELNLDVVFFETAMCLQKFPHMMMECVPIPRETGDLAPFYFKVREETLDDKRNFFVTFTKMDPTGFSTLNLKWASEFFYHPPILSESTINFELIQRQ
jgi:hypothetical protein